MICLASKQCRCDAGATFWVLSCIIESAICLPQALNLISKMTSCKFKGAPNHRVHKLYSSAPVAGKEEVCNFSLVYFICIHAKPAAQLAWQKQKAFRFQVVIYSQKWRHANIYNTYTKRKSTSAGMTITQTNAIALFKSQIRKKMLFVASVVYWCSCLQLAQHKLKEKHVFSKLSSYSPK